MARNIALVVYVIICCYASNVSSKKNCLSNDINPYELFGSISLYDQIRSTAGSDTTCTPVQFWSFHRHGTRYPNVEEISRMKHGERMRDKIIENYLSEETLPADALCEDDITKLKAWRWNPMVESMSLDLTKNGWDEMIEIAKRYQSRYPSILSSTYTPDDYLFKHTIERRAKDSCHAFIEGLFGNDTADIVQVPTPTIKDEVIRPYKTCDTWTRYVKASPNRLIEANNFRKSDIFLQMVADVSARLGFNKSLNAVHIETMYDNCRYYKTWFPNEISAWCSVFNKNELFYLEYLADLIAFYKSGYGHPYNTKLGCKALEYLVGEFEKTIKNGEAKPKAIHLFSHDTMLNMIYVAMGVFKDQEMLSGEQYHEFLNHRLFRNSLTTPFASNIVAVLHKCSSEIDDYEIQFFVNERPLKMEGCIKGLCSWKYIKKRFSSMFPCSLTFCDSEDPEVKNIIDNNNGNI